MLNKIILTNIIFFVLSIIIFTEPRNLLGVSPNIDTITTKPWVIITYMFFHEKPFHFLTNMFFLYAFGKIFLKYLSSEKLFSNYILGGLSGSVLFLIFSTTTHLILVNDPLIGCSASILSILVTSTIFTPNFSFKIRQSSNLSIKLKFITILFVIYSIVNPILSSNMGGLIAHIGGIFYGFLYALLIKKNINLGFFIEKIFEFNLNNNTQKIKRKKNEDDYEYNTRKKIEELELNKILEKINYSGYKSLSKKEKETLKKHSQN